MSAVVRPLGDAERTIWWIDRGSTLNFTTFARISGAMTPDKIERALAAAQARHPLLRVGIDASGTFVPSARAIPLRWVAGADRDAALHEELRALFDLESGPLARAAWVASGPTEGHLLLTLQHCVSDGKSGVFLMRDVLAALGDQPLAPLPLPAPLGARLPRAAYGPRMWLRALRSFGREALQYLRGRMHFLPREAGDVVGRRPSVCRFEIEPTQAQRLLERCRGEGTTVHGALMAALLQAVAAHLGGKRRISQGSPVDLRPHLEPAAGEDVGYFIGVVVSRHRVDPSAPLWPLAKQVRARIKTDIDRGMAAFFHRVGDALFKLLARGDATPDSFVRRLYRMPLAATGITNLGRLDIAEVYGEFTVHSVEFAVAPSVLGDLATTATSFRGRIHWNFCAQTPTMPIETARSIGEDAVQRLLSAL